MKKKKITNELTIKYRVADKLQWFSYYLCLFIYSLFMFVSFMFVYVCFFFYFSWFESVWISNPKILAVPEEGVKTPFNKFIRVVFPAIFFFFVQFNPLIVFAFIHLVLYIYIYIYNWGLLSYFCPCLFISVSFCCLFLFISLFYLHCDQENKNIHPHLQT